MTKWDCGMKYGRSGIRVHINTRTLSTALSENTASDLLGMIYMQVIHNTNGATRKSMYVHGDLCLNTCYFPSISIYVTFGPILVQATNSECRPDWGKNSVCNYCFNAVQHGVAYKTHYTTIKNNKNSIKTGTRSLVTWFRKTSSRSSMCTRMCVWKTQYCILVNFIQYWKHIFSIGVKVA